MSQRPNPQSIAICALIALYSDPDSPFHSEQNKIENHNIIDSFLEECVFDGFTMNGNSHTQQQQQTDDDDIMSLSLFLQKVRSRLGNNIANLVIDTLSMACESIDSLS